MKAWSLSLPLSGMGLRFAGTSFEFGRMDAVRRVSHFLSDLFTAACLHFETVGHPPGPQHLGKLSHTICPRRPPKSGRVHMKLFAKKKSKKRPRSEDTTHSPAAASSSSAGAASNSSASLTSVSAAVSAASAASSSNLGKLEHVGACDWAACGLNKWLIKSCDAMGLRAPTPVQRACIGAVLAGRDIIGCAPTGSG